MPRIIGGALVTDTRSDLEPEQTSRCYEGLVCSHGLSCCYVHACAGGGAQYCRGDAENVISTA